LAGGRSVTFNYTQLTKNVAGGSNVTLSSAEAGYKILKFTGLLTANINVVVPTTTTIWYVDNSTTGSYTLTVKTSAGSGVSTTNGTRYVLYGDGTNVVNAVTVTGSFSSFTSGSASAPSITFAADTDTGLYNTAANQVGVAVAGTQVANFTASGAAITGAVSAASAAITGAVSAASAAITGAVSADSAAITGAVSADSAAITGAVSADSASLTTPLPVTSGGTGTTTNPASAVANTPAGNIAATNVQAAINELDTEKAKSGANSDITSLSGLTGDITGLFSGATIADRVLFKTSTTNDGTILTLTPNGTSVLSYIELHNSSTPDVASSFASISVSSLASALVSGKSGAGSYLPLVFYTSGSEKFRIGTDGQIGLSGANYGSSGEVLTSNGAGSAPTWQAFSGVGVGQTWQNLTGSRSSGVTYTNSTGKPIQVHMTNNSNSSATTITVGGVTIFNTTILGPHSFIVPAGSTYVVSGGGGVVSWSELR